MTDGITSRYDDAGAHRMHARTYGDPRDPAVVLVHGLGLSGRYLEPLMRELDGLHVLAPDLPGIGDSDRPDRPLTVTEHADALATWIDAVGLDRPLLVGHSVGAQVVALAAERHPEQASGLVLISPNGDPLARAPLRQAARLVLDAPLERPSLIPVATVDYLRSGPWRMWRTLRWSSDIDLDVHLRHVPHPALVVRGQRDLLVSRYWAATLALALPHGTAVQVDGAAHGVVHSSPAQIAQLIRRSLRA